MSFKDELSKIVREDSGSSEETDGIDEEKVIKLISVPLNLDDAKVKKKLTKDDLYNAIIKLHKKNQEAELRVNELEAKANIKSEESLEENVSNEYATFRAENDKHSRTEMNKQKIIPLRDSTPQPENKKPVRQVTENKEQQERELNWVKKLLMLSLNFRMSQMLNQKMILISMSQEIISVLQIIKRIKKF